MTTGEDGEVRDWLAHDGGPCPVDPDQRVEVRHRSGETSETYIRSKHYRGDNRARSWYWRHDGDAGDIVAYRLLTKAQGASHD